MRDYEVGSETESFRFGYKTSESQDAILGQRETRGEEDGQSEACPTVGCLVTSVSRRITSVSSNTSFEPRTAWQLPEVVQRKQRTFSKGEAQAECEDQQCGFGFCALAK